MRRLVIASLVGLAAVPLVVPSGAAAASLECATVTPAALSGFFDDLIPRQLTENRIPGGVVSVVSGGRTAFAQGYGTSDVDRGKPFDESRSLVRIASITKLFTWTAVMQQVEAGRLDLRADVNRYLKGFQIPATYPEPVTLRHLMDHTAGFEDRIIATAATEESPLGEYLARHLPARIRPPGEISAYSNYGAALAGHIVAEVSGEPYDAYVQRHLLDPLGMAHSTAAQPVPAALAADLAGSYDSDAEPPSPIPFMLDALPPDGSVSATATDMASFMNAHLRQGQGLLTPATAALMHQRSFSADPRLDGYAHGFKEKTINGHRLLMHDGGWEGFRSALILVPGCDLGLFVSFNATGGAVAGGELMTAFFDRFVPPSAGTEGTATATTSAPQAGFYKPTRHNQSTVEKVTTLLSPSRLAVDADGTVHFKGKTWTTQGQGLYRMTDGDERLVALSGSDGRQYVATDGVSYQLMPDSETLFVNLAVLLVFAVPALSTLILPIAALVRRIRRRPATSPGDWRLARGLAAGSAVLGVLFLVLLMATLIGNTEEFLYAVPLSFKLLLALPLIVLGGAVAATVYTVKGWRGARILARIHQVAVLAGMVALTWFLWQWNLLGWQYA